MNQMKTTKSFFFELFSPFQSEFPLRSESERKSFLFSNSSIDFRCSISLFDWESKRKSTSVLVKFSTLPDIHDVSVCDENFRKNTLEFSTVTSKLMSDEKFGVFLMANAKFVQMSSLLSLVEQEVLVDCEIFSTIEFFPVQRRRFFSVDIRNFEMNLLEI